MKRRHIIALVLISTGLYSCTGMIINQCIIGDYYLTAPDIPEQSTISYRNKKYKDSYLTIIPETVFSVGHNKQYIIAKRHPNINSFSKLDKSIIYYYILPVKSEFTFENKNGLIGPLNEIQFKNQLKALGIQNVVFDIEIECIK